MKKLIVLFICLMIPCVAMADGSFGTLDTTVGEVGRQSINGCAYKGGSATSNGAGTLDSIRILIDDAGTNDLIKVALFKESDSTLVDSCAGVTVDLGGVGIQKFDFVLGTAITDATGYYFMCTANGGTYSVLKNETGSEYMRWDLDLCYGTAWHDPFSPTHSYSGHKMAFEVFWSSVGGGGAWQGQVVPVSIQ